MGSKVLKNLNKQGLIKILHIIARRSFKFFEKYFQLHITPAHFYSPIPITNQLDQSVFSKIFDCTGIDWNLSAQLKFLEDISGKYSLEYTPVKNTGLSLVDAFVLYAMIREKKPKVMIEVGAGESTKISLQALEKNLSQGHAYRFYSIDPYPKKELQLIKKKNFELIDKKLQDVDEEFLIRADLLFIDSSHVSKIGSDVNYQILEIIPKLKIGAIVHWHDIMIPTNYWKEWIDNGNMFWNESYMVHSFMLFNESFRTMWTARYMQLNYFNRIQQVLPFFQKNHRLSSFWIERAK